MSKSKTTRKPSASQADKYNIQIAKWLKQKGLVSKQANLHQGRFISKDVLKKVQNLKWVFESGYTTIKVTPKQAKEAAIQGFTATRNRIVAPNNRKAQAALRKAEYGGVVPVRSGYIEAVKIPGDIYTVRQLAQNAKKLDALKRDEEVFAFKLKGYLSWKFFRSTQAMVEYLSNYTSVQENEAMAFSALNVVRLNSGDFKALRLQSSDENEEKRRLRDLDRRAKDRDRSGGKSYYRKMASGDENRFKRFKKRLAKQSQTQYEKMKSDPIRYAAYLEKRKLYKRSRKGK